jgi:crotonobetainyl-CoA:carnitine CoA-transferase CaiB-like acyl-CoA transferase
VQEVWWPIIGRNKRSLVLDDADPDRSQALRAINPRLVMASISGFGQTGPHASRPGFGKIAEAMSGIVMLTGSPDEVPIHIGFSLADTSAGLMAAFGLALGLYQRDVGGEQGSHADVALFEPLFRMTECQLALTERMGRAPLREGSNDPYGWGASGEAGVNPDALRAVRCTDGHWLMLRASAPDEIVGRAEALPIGEALALLAREEVAAAQVHDGATINASAYFRARGDVREVNDPVIGPVCVSGEIPKAWAEPDLPLFRPTRPDADRGRVLGPEQGEG